MTGWFLDRNGKMGEYFLFRFFLLSTRKDTPLLTYPSDDWLQQMHKNATAKSGVSTGVLDCTMLHSENCSPVGDGDCDNYDPASCTLQPLPPFSRYYVIRIFNDVKIVALIQTQAVNLYGILQAMDIASIKNTLLEMLNLDKLISQFVPDSTLLDRKKKFSLASVSEH